MTALLNTLDMPRVQPVHGWHCQCHICSAHPRPLPATTIAAAVALESGGGA